MLRKSAPAVTVCKQAKTAPVRASVVVRAQESGEKAGFLASAAAASLVLAFSAGAVVPPAVAITPSYEVAGLFDGPRRAVENAVGDAQNAVSDAASNVQNAAGAANALNNAPDAIKGAVKSAVANPEGAAKDAKNAAKNAFNNAPSDVKSAAKNAFNSAPSDVKSAAKKAFNSSPSDVKNAAKDVAGDAQGAVEKVKSAVPKAFRNSLGAPIGLPSIKDVADSVSSAVGKAENAVEAVPDALRTGAVRARDKAENAPKAVTQYLKKNLGPPANTPSAPSADPNPKAATKIFIPGSAQTEITRDQATALGDVVGGPVTRD